jgi:glycosyltransferase involved in cell wall biosynthesis
VEALPEHVAPQLVPLPRRRAEEHLRARLSFGEDALQSLIVLGRHSNDAQADLKRHLDGTAVELHVLGVLPAEDVARTLCISDVLLFVRGPISTRRGSAIAGIACGLPVVAFSGAETAPPITEAGLALYSPQRKGDLGDVLLRVLEDEHYRASLAQQSWLAQAKYFSWGAIAARYAEFMRKPL